MTLKPIMADLNVSSVDEELASYFVGFNNILQELESSSEDFASEYLERKLEDYLSILFGIFSQLENGESTEQRNSMPTFLKRLYDLVYQKLQEMKDHLEREQSSLNRRSGYYVHAALLSPDVGLKSNKIDYRSSFYKVTLFQTNI